jgi:hypothetical protein
MHTGIYPNDTINTQWVRTIIILDILQYRYIIRNVI